MNELQNITNQDLVNWNCESQLKTIKDIYCKNSTNEEFHTFINIGKATGLNPFLKEIWFIKYAKDSPASIFIARDGYRRSAQANQNYDYHFCDAVYSNDSFRINEGQVQHEYKIIDRGILMGAYCVVKRKTSSRPIYVYVELKEYDTNKSLWANKKSTMIKKVAEAQGLRMAFQELFSNTYHESEYVPETRQDNAHKADEKINQLIEGKVQSQIYVSTNEIVKKIKNSKTYDELHALHSECAEVDPMDKEAVREYYKNKKNELKNIEVVVPLTEDEKIKNQLIKATSKDTLDIAADLISSATENNQADLYEIYNNRKKDFE